MRCREDLYWEMNQMMGSFDSHVLCCPIQIVVGKKVAVLRDKNIHIWLKCYQRFITWVVWWCFCHSCHSCDAFVTVVMLLSQLSQLWWCFCHSCDALSQSSQLWCFCHSCGCDAFVTPMMRAGSVWGRRSWEQQQNYRWTKDLLIACNVIFSVWL